MTRESSRLNLKGNATKFKDDDYETPKEIIEDIIKFIPDNVKTIYDPFYCKGNIVKAFNDLGYKCINEKKDAFNREHPKDDEYELIFSNVPFSLKKESFKLFESLNKPYIILTTVDYMGSNGISDFFDNLQFILPKSRYWFLKNNESKSGAWFDTCFYCKGLKLEKDIIKLKEKKQLTIHQFNKLKNKNID